MTDVYFGVWDDADLGDSQDDLVGCDTLLQGGYTYNDGPDAQYGNNPPGYFKKTLAGPVTYIPGVTYIDINGNEMYDEGIDTPLDTAYVHRGLLLGISEYPGAKNQTLSSSIHYINNDPNLRDPSNKEEARNYILGFNRIGELPDPCTWSYGDVRGGVNCSQVNPFFWYSGDPVADYGWINIYMADQRQMQNVGPFNLEQGEEIEIFVAHVIGQGNDPLSSISETKNLANISQELYDCNFDPICIVSVDEQIELQPDKFVLYQNYPNPFNPSTKISYQIPTLPTGQAGSLNHSKGGTLVTLKVHDILGSEVATIVNEEQPAGTYEVEFNASQLSSGIYFYQLKAGDFIQTNKMVLIR
jgi:hypothetical protein